MGTKCCALWDTSLYRLLITLLLMRHVATMSISSGTLNADDDLDEFLEQYGRFMLGNINKSVNPCENFYDYACGNWQAAEMVQLKINENIKNFLENVTADELKMETQSAELKAKQFYHSCLEMNGARNMALAYEQLTKQFANRFIDHVRNETEDWIYINFMSQYGVYPLLPLKVHYNPEMRKYDILLTPPEVILGNTELFDIKNMTRDFKLIDDDKDFVTEYETLVAFEKNLTAHASEHNETEYFELAEFLKTHETMNQTHMNWTRYFNLAFNGTEQLLDDCYVMNTLDDVNTLVRFLQKTNTTTLRAYIKWCVLVKFYAIWKQNNETFDNDNTTNTFCRKNTEEYFDDAIIPWFIENTFDSTQRADILQIAKNMKDTFYELIENYNWLDDDTKSHARTKLISMDIKVGYTDNMQHRSTIDQLYNDLNISKTNWFENLQLLERKKAYQRLLLVNRAFIAIIKSTSAVNAHYYPLLNEAHIKIGIMQWPLYHLKFPVSLKYGGIGFTVAHEIGHGFDSTNYQFNYDGKMENWWSAAALRNFRERFRCLESQYNKYISLGIQTNGNRTSADNIADNIGARLSYYAFMKDIEHATEAEKYPIPGLNYTNEQLYFLKFAQSWCSGKDNAVKRIILKSDVHAWNEFRVVGTLSNMPEFSEAFKCQLGTDMNPLKKCIVW